MQGEEEDADNKQVLQLREWINNLAVLSNKRTITQNETDPHRQTFFMNFYCLQTSTLTVLLLANKTSQTLIYIFIKK